MHARVLSACAPRCLTDDLLGQWPHNTGPLMTYMASCGNTTCDKFDSLDAGWFKIDEVGKKSDGTTWYQQDISECSFYLLTAPSRRDRPRKADGPPASQ